MQKTSPRYIPSPSRTVGPAAALLAAMLAATSAHAASQTWTNSASDLQWNTSSLDWSGAAWTNNNDAVFGATGVGSIAVASDVIVNDIAFNTAGYTLTGNLMLANDQASTFTATQSATIGAVIADNTAGASSLTKAGANTLTLSGANTYTGGTTLGAGTLVIGNNSAFGTGALALNGGTLKNATTSNWVLANNISVGGGTTIDGAGKNLNLNGNISGSGALSVTSSVNTAATLTLGGDNSGYTGSLTTSNNLQGNALSFTSASAGSASAAWVFNDNRVDRVRITIAGGGTINFGSMAGAGNIQNDALATTSTISVGALNTSTTFSGTMKNNSTGILALTKVGTGMLTLSGASTYTGGTTISAGKLNVTGSISGAGAVAVSGGTAATLGGTGTVGG